MDDHIKTALHICNDTESKIAAEYPYLKVIFIPVQDNDRQAAVKSKQNDILKNSSGKDAWDDLQKIIKNNTNLPAATRLFTSKEAHIIPLLSKSTALVCIMVSIDEPQDPHIFRHSIISQAYPAIKTISTHSENKTPEDKTLKDILIADSFAALAMQLAGYNGTIDLIARHQSENALKARLNKTPENTPFPLAIDAARILFEELATEKAKRAPAHSAFKMSQELAETFDDIMVNKWTEFAHSAQLMAWGYYNKEEILGLAVHTCEDPHIRAIAHIVADITKTKSKIATHLKKYNPFTEEEANARHHQQLCARILKNLLTHIKNDKDFDFKTTINTINSQLIKGQPLGWCAPALTECEALLSRLIEDAKDAENPNEAFAKIPGTITKQFESSMQELPWPVIEDIFKMIIKAKKTGHAFTGNSLLAMLKQKQHPKIGLFETIFAPYQNTLIYDRDAEKKAAYEAEFGGLYLEDNEDSAEDAST